MPRWFLLVFAVVVVIAIVHEAITDANRTEPTFYESMRADQLAHKEAAAIILARARAEDAFAAQACSADACDEASRAAVQVAHETLTSGGCVDWEMSEWDPSRGLAARAVPKSQADAEAECLAQAEAIADRIVRSAAARRQRSSASQ